MSGDVLDMMLGWIKEEYPTDHFHEYDDGEDQSYQEEMETQEVVKGVFKIINFPHTFTERFSSSFIPKSFALHNFFVRGGPILLL